jgi:hypothetical protein
VKKQLPTLEVELLPSCYWLPDLLTTIATSYYSWLEYARLKLQYISKSYQLSLLPVLLEEEEVPNPSFVQN